MMCNVHAGLPELVGELFPDEEVEQLPGLGHHHLAACHVVQGLNEFLQMLNSEMLKNLIMIKVQEIPHHNHSGQCSPMQCFEGLDQDSGLPIGRRYHWKYITYQVRINMCKNCGTLIGSQPKAGHWGGGGSQLGHSIWIQAMWWIFEYFLSSDANICYDNICTWAILSGGMRGEDIKFFPSSHETLYLSTNCQNIVTSGLCWEKHFTNWSRMDWNSEHRHHTTLVADLWSDDSCSTVMILETDLTIIAIMQANHNGKYAGEPDGGEETKPWTFEAGQSVLGLADQGAQCKCWKIF